MLDFDTILEQADSFGVFQKVLYILICLPASFPCAWSAFNQVFATAEPPYWCRLPDADELGLNLTVLEMKDLLLPKAYIDGKVVYHPCKIYNVSIDQLRIYGTDANYSAYNATTCDEYDYDSSTYLNTAVTHFELYCDRQHLVTLCTTIFYVGSFIGNILFGWLGDKYGRRPTFFLILAVQTVAGTASAFSPHFTVFMILRFIGGLCFPALYQIPFIIGVEFMGPQGRIYSGLVVCIFFGTAMCLLGFVAEAIRKWKLLIIVSNAPFAVLFSYWWILPESPRWQVSQGKVDEATDTLVKVAKYNNRTLDRERTKHELNLLYHQNRSHTGSDQHSLMELFRPPGLRRKTIILTFVWLVNSFVYNGLTYNVTNLGVNDYRAFAINGAVELPAYFIIWPLLDRVGRRWLLAGSMLMGGIACLLCIFVPKEHDMAISGLAFFGKFGNAASFAVLYIFAGELFPTVLRALGMGLSSMIAGFSLILGPYAMRLAEYLRILPLLLMGILTVVAGVASMFLPETAGSHLPQTVEDAEAYGKGFGFWYILPKPTYTPTRSEGARLCDLGKEKDSKDDGNMFEILRNHDTKECEELPSDDSRTVQFV